MAPPSGSSSTIGCSHAVEFHGVPALPYEVHDLPQTRSPQEARSREAHVVLALQDRHAASREVLTMVKGMMNTYRPNCEAKMVSE